MTRKPAAAPAIHDLRIRVIAAMSEIPAADWDRCAGGSSADAGLDAAGGLNPFTRHAFLAALEVSKSATARTGWQPQHLVAEGADGTIIGVVPCYLKSHSRGEYVFDAGWADAYERAGGSYYPKLQVSVPFTPATGRRVLVAPGQPAGVTEAALAQGLIELCKLRDDQQFHWENGGFSCFDDFLAALASRKRKVIKRERRDGLADGIEVVWLTGSDLTEAAWDAFFAFYTDTGSRKWGRPYLTREFFSRLSETMADQTVLIMAKRAGRFIAGAINFVGAGTLFGRHWGAIEHHPFLHFEICYYQAIEYAIAHKLARVEAGAQGEHKLARGYLPATTYSAHYIADPALRRAIDDYLARERAYVEAAGRELLEASPFRKDAAQEDAGF
jgi:uncharacterized protein